MILQSCPIAYDTALNIGSYPVSLCICPVQKDMDETSLQNMLHAREADYLRSLKYERRRRTFLYGRYVAKRAIVRLNEGLSLNRICVDRGVFGHPVVSAETEGSCEVSITHCDDAAAAIAFPAQLPVGIDMEIMAPDKENVLMAQLTNDERRLLRSGYPRLRMLTLLWTVKEALSKVLKTGLTTPLELFEVSSVELLEDASVSRFVHFSQYAAVSYIWGSQVCSIVYPKQAAFDYEALGQWLFASHQSFSLAKER